MALIACVPHSCLFCFPASSFDAEPAYCVNPRLNHRPFCIPAGRCVGHSDELQPSPDTGIYVVSSYRGFGTRNFSGPLTKGVHRQSQAGKRAGLLDTAVDCLKEDEMGETTRVKGSWPGKRDKEALKKRIVHETCNKRKGDRDLTPTVRALTWALRGAQDAAAVDAIVEDLQFSLSVFTSVIQKLGMEGKPDAAVGVLRWLQQKDEEIARPNVYTYNSLLGALKANRCYEMAGSILEEMRENGPAPDIVTFNTVISMYDQQHRYGEAMEVYEDLKGLGILPCLFTYRNVIQILARSGDVERALEIFSELKQHESRGVELKREKEQREELDQFVVQMCCRRLWAWLADDTSTSLQISSLLERMRRAQVVFDAKMCKDLIRACGQRDRDHVLVKALYISMRDQEFPTSVSVYNHVIKVLGKGKKWWAALEVYEDMLKTGPPPNEATQRLLLSHFKILLNSARERRIGRWAVQLLDKMIEKGIEPDAFAWNSAVIACAQSNETAAAVQVFQRMADRGQKPGILSYGALLSALEKGSLHEKAEQVWQHMHKVGVKPNDYAYTTMISAYGKWGKYGDAMKLLDEMRTSGQEPTVVTYNALITACARAADGQRALEWLEQMKAALVKPDAITYAQVIEALANEGQWKPALSLYVKMTQLKLDPPCTAYDAVVRVCKAHNAHAAVGVIGLRPQNLRWKHRRKEEPESPLILADNSNATISAAI